MRKQFNLLTRSNKQKLNQMELTVSSLAFAILSRFSSVKCYWVIGLFRLTPSTRNHCRPDIDFLILSCSFPKMCPIKFFLSIPNETWRFRWIRMDASRLISLYLFYKWVKSHLTLFNIIQVECIWEMSWIKQKASPRWRRDYGLWKTFKRLWLLLRLPEEPNLYSLKDIRRIKEQFAYRFMDKKSKCCWPCWHLSVQ